MKASLRLTLQITAVVIFLFLIVPVFMPHDVTIKSSTEINAPVEIVFNKVNTLKKRKEWSPFEDDSTMVDNYSGPTKGVGARRSWTSERLGNGHMMIINCIPNRLIETKLDFGTPGTAKGRWVFAEKQGKTKVEWQLHILNLKYPFGKWLGLVMNKLMKPVLAKGLHQLKNEVEKQKSGSPEKKTS